MDQRDMGRPVSLQSRRSGGFSSSQIVEALIGSDTIALKGFAAGQVGQMAQLGVTSAPGSFPLVSAVHEQAGQLEGELTDVWRARDAHRLHWLRRAAGLVLSVVLFTAACTWVIVDMAHPRAPAASGEVQGWRLLGLTEEGVRYEWGARTMLATIGSTLPDGQKLLEVQQAQGTFRTDKNTYRTTHP